jgi:hypothetical protein
MLENKPVATQLQSIDVLGNLINRGEQELKSTVKWLTPDYEAEFREAVAGSVPLLNKLLDDCDEDVRQKTVEVIGKLANDGERKLDGIAE